MSHKIDLDTVKHILDLVEEANYNVGTADARYYLADHGSETEAEYRLLKKRYSKTAVNLRKSLLEAVSKISETA